MSVREVLAGTRPWHAEQGDVIPWLDSLPDDCVDLLFTSPPYVQARQYREGGKDLGIARSPEQWVAWMIRVAVSARRVCKGLCAFVVEGQTHSYRYDATPFLLMADLHRLGFNLRKPPAYRRVGIPGSGGPDWFRNDWEPVVCFARPGRLPWSDTTACGRPPVHAPGGIPSNRTAAGDRVNRDRRGESFSAPALANPGNVVRQKYTAEEVAELLGETADVLDCKVGGGQLGSPLAHRNEAPFPEDLPERFVLSFCPPGGLVVDPFSGSGTTGAVARRHGRRFLGIDLRKSQVDLSIARLGSETPSLFADPATQAPPATSQPSLFGDEP